MNKENKINDFLKKFASFYTYNPGFPINSDTFYSALCVYGTGLPFFEKVRKDFDIVNTFFPNWIKEFEKAPNINVFLTDKMHDFLMFTNLPDYLCDSYKLYVTFPKDKLYNSVSKIFHFLERNDIEHESKVAYSIRSDSIVMRIFNFEDSVKIINYINADNDLFIGMGEVNPFLLNVGKIGLTYDKNLSFNESLCFLLEQYFRYKRASNNLNSVNVGDFRTYVYNIFYNMDKDFDVLQQLLNSNLVRKNIKRLEKNESVEDVLVNYKNVFEMVYYCMDSKFSINDYFALIEKFKSPTYYRSEIRGFKALIKNSDNYEFNPKGLIAEYIVYGAMKYGIDNVSYFVQGYLNGEQNAITRDCNFRNLFKRYITPDIVKNIVGSDINSYVKIIMEEKSLSVFNEVVSETEKKYGKNQLIEALKAGMIGDFSKFTNGKNNDLRKKILQFVQMDYYMIYARMALESLERNNKRVG